MKKLLLIGGGGHCHSVLDTILALEEYTNIGIIDNKDYIGKTIMGVKVIGSDEDLKDLYKDGYKFAFITVGSIGKPLKRIKLFENSRKLVM